jgi:tripartite-type tricarboxylate transporter receptor subunit TctC
MAASTSVEAQPYPVKPVRIITGFGPGGSTDVVARLVAQKLGEYLRQPFVVENRPGASTALAAERVASAPPDGYTLLLLASSTTSQSALRKASLPYDLESGFVHISLLAVGPFVLVVHPSVPVKDAGELIKLARARPGRLNYGSPGVGSVNHLAALIFNQRASLKMTHIAYKGSSEATVANASGQIDLSFPSVPAALPLIEQRRVRALAVTSAKRTPVLPDVPTIAESALPGYEYVGAIGLSAPAATPRELVNRLNAAISAILNKQELREAIGKSGFEAQTSSSEQFAAFVRDDIAKIEAVVKGAGLQAD